MTVVHSSLTVLNEISRICGSSKSAISAGIIHVDLGRLDDEDYLIDPNSFEFWPRYHETIPRQLALKKHDFIMITGRFRVARFMQAVLHGPPETLIAMLPS